MSDSGRDLDDERRRRIMERLAEMLQGPPPGSEGTGAVTGGGIEAAISRLGLGITDDDAARLAGVVGEGPDPEEATAMFMAMLEGFQAWQRRPGREGSEAGDDRPDDDQPADDQPDAG
ncbi:MAG: hypothetical protein ACRDZ3_10400 [Acidimicrobiia bacterium]